MGYLSHNKLSGRYPEEAWLRMMLVVIVLAVVVLAGSVWADYRWRRWIAERRRDRGPQP